MSESNANYSINEPRFQRVIKYATSASKQIPGALVRVAESEETDINTVRLTRSPSITSTTPDSPPTRPSSPRTASPSPWT